MNNSRLITAFVLSVAAALAVTAALASADGERKVEGTIVEVRERVATSTSGSSTQIRVRTRSGQLAWLRLGPPSDRGNTLRVGDRIRAHVVEDGSRAPAMRRARNSRSGEILSYRGRHGAPAQHRHGAPGDGTGAAKRERTRSRAEEATRARGGQRRGRP